MKPAVVLIRLDKIGDLISTIPVDEIDLLAPYQVEWIISKGLSFIPNQSVPLRNYTELDARNPRQSFFVLLKFLKEKKPKLAISFQAPWWVSLALWLAQVPLRVGSSSQWHSFLFLNKALRQKRSKAIQHEADYNADLVYFAFDKKKGSHPTPVLKLKAPSGVSVSSWKLEPQQYIVVHPGMAGSALNWPVEKYIELIQGLRKKITVVVTGTAADEIWLKEIKSTFQTDSENGTGPMTEFPVKILQGLLSSTDLLEVLAEAKSVVAPSTGVLHLAASLGVPSFGIYSPIKVQHPKRWQARGPQVQIFVPNVPCPAQFQCLGPSCKYYNCMNQISVAELLQSV